MLGRSGHHAEGHQCPPYVLDEEECEFLRQVGEYDYEGGHYELEDAVFWIPHQQDIGRMVEFNTLTSSIEDIITQCGYPESERARLTAQHRRNAEDFLKRYQGPLEGPVPLLGETQPTTTG